MLHHVFFFFVAAFLLLSSFPSILVAASATVLNSSDATALLAFKSSADLIGHLPFSLNTTFRFCQWHGVGCSHQKVVRLLLQGLDLGGVFAPDTLSRLDQLRVLSLQNNSLTGPIPDLSKLRNLKSLFLDRNFFSGSFPPSISSLHRLRTLDLSHNNLTGPIPTRVVFLDRLYYLRLDWNRFNGSIPPLNQSSLQTLNVSYNNFTGAIPVTTTLIRFEPSSFLSNPSLCGEIIHKECRPSPPFFGPSSTAAPPPAVTLSQSAELHGVDLAQPSPKPKHKRTAVIIGFCSGVFLLMGSLICFAMAVRKQKQRKTHEKKPTGVNSSEEAAAMQIDEQEKELEEKVKRVEGMHVGKSGTLNFCAGEAHLYSLDQLMRASAELLGRGTMGTTYKAVLDNRLIVSVKRLDAAKLAATSKEVFEQHMESVGGLRHPNLVPLRAYFQAREERLLVYDYHPNGSLFSLIHGSRSSGAKPLHWTSCLKIAEDVAQGLSYIHQAWRLVHGNLKSSNVLLGPDFEACLADYSLTLLSFPPPPPSSSDVVDDPYASAYKAPETYLHPHHPTSKSDIYAYGILLFELLTGYPPSHLPSIPEMVSWVRSRREDHDGRLEMLLEVAMVCSSASAEQRPTMWQVLKMLQEIKESVVMEDGDQLDTLSGDVLT